MNNKLIHLISEQDAVTPLSESEAIDLVKTCFASATERDIFTVSLFLQHLSFDSVDFNTAIQ